MPKTMIHPAPPGRRGLRGAVTRYLFGGVAAIGLACAFGGVALAAAQYSVKLSVPTLVQGAQFKVKATGVAKNTSRLTVFIASKCAANPKAEASVQSVRQIVSKNVVRSFSASKTTVAGAAGSHRVCAYLTPTKGSTVRAHASATYTALLGAY